MRKREKEDRERRKEEKRKRERERELNLFHDGVNVFKLIVPWEAKFNRLTDNDTVIRTVMKNTES